MIAAVLGLAWGGLALAAAARCRPAPRRARALVRAQNAPGGARRSPLESLGRLVWRTAGRVPSPEQARRAGAAALATVPALVLAPLWAPLPALLAWALPLLRARREEARRLGRLEADLPQAVDLLSLAVGAGLNVALAVAAAGRRGTGPVAAELRRVTAEVAAGRRLAEALDDLPARAGEPLRPLAAALAGCERYGGPVVPALDRLADDARRRRQRRAEEAARKVPVKLLFPLVLCILPAFALLTVAPLVMGAVRQLRL